MERKTANAFDQELLDLYDYYVHGAIDRRTFLDARKYAVGGMTAAALLESLSPHYAWAEQVPKDDKRVKTEYVTTLAQGAREDQGLPGAAGEGSGKLPGVLVVHENRGLNPDIEDVARRLAVAASWPSRPTRCLRRRLSRRRRQGARAASQARPRQDHRGLRRRRGLRCTATRARTASWASSASASAAFVSNTLAVRMPELAAAVPFYGSQVAGRRRAEDQGVTAAPLRGHRRTGERGLAGLRGSAEGEQGGLHGAHLPGHQPRLPQRHHAALRRGGGQAGLAAHAGVLRLRRFGSALRKLRH